MKTTSGQAAPAGRAAGAPASRRACAYARACEGQRGPRRGGALVEFAFVALAFYLLLAGTIEVGRMVFALQALQNAARVGARELALFPLPAASTFDDALQNPDVRERVFDPGLLVLDITGMTDAAVQDRLDNLPALNRMLIPLMIREEVDIGTGPGGDRRALLRYPGALLRNPDYDPADPLNAHEFNVGIPNVVASDTDGTMRIEWLPVVEEVVPDGGATEAPFSMVSTGRLRGVVALRIHYPFQAATLSAYRDIDPGPGVLNAPILADDGAVTQLNAAPGTPISYSSSQQVYSGRYGLGRQYALSREVRPYRRVLAAQALFTREAFTR